jgi:hypothetical protein
MKKTANKASPPPSPTARYSPTHQETSAKAEEIWHRLGRPSGRDDEIWFAAERALSKRSPAFDETGINDELDALFPDTDRDTPTAL